MSGWKREDWFDATGLAWVDPSPNIRSPHEALLYPGLAMLEYSTNYSVGRGTDSPFEEVGADWIEGRTLAAYLTKRAIPGVRIYPTTFSPTASYFSGKTIEGIGFEVTDRDVFNSSKLGIEVMMALARLYPRKIRWEASKTLIGSSAVIAALSAGGDAADAAQKGMAEFRQLREKYLLYR
jgi:uncharacterized protein YbbC (DUF1343 family)